MTMVTPPLLPLSVKNVSYDFDKIPPTVAYLSWFLIPNCPRSKPAGLTGWPTASPIGARGLGSNPRTFQRRPDGRPSRY